MMTRGRKVPASGQSSDAGKKSAKQPSKADMKITKAESIAEAAASRIPSDSDEEEEEDDDEEDLNSEEQSDEVSNDEDEDDFEDQGSSSDDNSLAADSEELDSEGSDAEKDLGAALTTEAEARTRAYPSLKARDESIRQEIQSGLFELQQRMNTDDLSSDDEEDPTGNTIGRVPLHWYDAYDHMGYNIEGGKVLKRKGQDRIDIAIANSGAKGGDARRTIYDMYNDREVVLSERDLEIIRRIQSGAFAHAEHNDTPDYVDYFTHEIEKMPISAAPPSKSSFIPSKWEMMRVMKIVRAIKEGKYVDLKTARDNKRKEDDVVSGLFLVWNDLEDETLAESKKYAYHLPAPKIPLPGHAESYNPPSEYLLSEQEKKEFEEMDPSERPYDFIPKQHSCLRHVAGYPNLVKERFERCLDLYLCPRQLKKRLNIDPETLIPRLPKPKELKPFPNALCLQYLGHKKAVRSISISPDGQYLVSGSEDGTVMLWEVDCCLCRQVWDFKGVPVTSVVWNPNPSHHLIAAAVGKSVFFITTGTGDRDSTELTDTLLEGCEQRAGQKNQSGAADDDGESESDGENAPMAKKGTLKGMSWKPCPNAVSGNRIGPRVELSFSSAVTAIAWHHRGDYFAVLCPDAGSQATTVHQLSKVNSQAPFKKAPGKIQSFSFHPSLPFFFVVTQQHVKVYHLVEQKLIKRLLSGCKWLSSIDIHPSGDHVILGSYDRRVVWFDMDLSSTPYKTLKFHEKAIRSVQFHRRFPLMASASDDGSVHVFHSTVYNDLTRNPLIVPLKILKGHGVIGGVGVLSVAFHPRQPWLFSSGADGVINLYQDI